MKKNPKRMTDSTRRYSSKILQRLQAYEDIATVKDFKKFAEFYNNTKMKK